MFSTSKIIRRGPSTPPSANASDRYEAFAGGPIKANKAQRVIRDCQGRLADSIGTGIGIGLQTLAVSRATSLNWNNENYGGASNARQ